MELLEEIQDSVEEAVRRILEKDELSLKDIVLLRDAVREILSEGPREVVVRWVDDWDDKEEAEDVTEEGPEDGSKS